MSRSREEHAVAGQGAGGLTKKQIIALATMARKAYAAQSSLGLADAFKDFDTWRKGVLYHLTERTTQKDLTSFKKITQREYSTVFKRFAELAMMSETAARCKSEEEDEAARARHILYKTMEEEAVNFDGGFNGALRYASKVCADQYGCICDKATAKQIWRVIYTIKNRAKARF